MTTPTPSWPELEQLLEQQESRETYTVSDLEAAAQALFEQTFSRRYLQNICKQYALVLGLTLQNRIRRNFVETLLSPEQFRDVLSIMQESRLTDASINELLVQRKTLMEMGEESLYATPMSPLEMAANINRLIIETMECKERASGAEDLAIDAQKRLQRVEEKLDELLRLLRR